MNDSTKAMYAKILADAQAKASAKSQPAIKAIAAIPTPKQEPVKPTPAPSPIPQPKPVFKPDVKDILPDIQAAPTGPELSATTFADLMNSKPDQPTPAQAKLDIEIKKYNALSFVVIGKDTYPIKDQLKAKGGVWNRFLKCGPAWCFSNKKYYTIKTYLDSVK